MRTQSEIKQRIVTIENDIGDLLKEQQREEGFPSALNIKKRISHKRELKDLLNWVLND